jgi:hypothetical protein
VPVKLPPPPPEALAAADDLRTRVRRGHRLWRIESKVIARKAGVSRVTMTRFLRRPGSRNRIDVPTEDWTAAVTATLDRLETIKLRAALAALDPEFAAWDAARQAGGR